MAIPAKVILSLVLLAAPTFGLPRNQYCGDGVQTALGSFNFNGSTPDDYWGNLCINELGVISLAANIKTYCSAADLAPGWAIVQEYCTETSSPLPEWPDVATRLTESLMSSLQVVEFDDIDPTKTWNTSVLLSEDLYTTSYRTSVC
jgi:hypothetical protein